MLFLRRLVAKLQALQNDNKEEYKIDPFVELYLNPNCKHTVTIRASLGEMWAQMVNIVVNNDNQIINNLLIIPSSLKNATNYRFVFTAR